VLYNFPQGHTVTHRVKRGEFYTFSMEKSSQLHVPDALIRWIIRPIIIVYRDDIFSVFNGKPEGKRPLLRLTRQSEDAIKLDFGGRVYCRFKTGPGYIEFVCSYNTV
jgi:hypothetical protein